MLNGLNHFVCTKSLQLCPELCNPMDHTPPGFSVLGILQAKILELIACSPLGNLPSPSIVFVSLMSYELQADSLLLNHQGNPKLNSNGPFS